MNSPGKPQALPRNSAVWVGRASAVDAPMYARVILYALVLIQFFPLPRIPLLSLAPENFVFLIAMLAMFTIAPALFRRDRRTLKLSAIFLAFAFLTTLSDYVHDEFQELPFEHVRTIVFVLLLAYVCSYERTRMQVVKLLLVVGAIQVIFGLLIYAIGEPFASIRNWMMLTRNAGSDEVFITKGSQLASLYGLPHTFSYLLASFPVLCLAMYFIEKKPWWLVVFLLMLLGLFVNAERAATGALLVCSLLLLYKTEQFGRSAVVLGVACVALFAIQQLVGRLQPSEAEIGVETSFTHGTIAERMAKTSGSEFVDRITWGLNGAKAVLSHPLLGASAKDYVRATLGKTSHAVVTADEVLRVPAPHNHYINIGMRAGVIGWVLGVSFLLLLLSFHRSGKAGRQAPSDRVLHYGISLALLAALLNAFFHNAGFFTPEQATSCLVGVLIGSGLAAARPRRPEKPGSRFVD